MKTQCPHCNAEMTIPDNYAGAEIKCLKCKKPFTPEQHNAKHQISTLVTIAIGIMIIFGLVVAMFMRESSKTHRLESKIAQLEKQNKDLIAQIDKLQKQESREVEQLKREVQRRQAELETLTGQDEQHPEDDYVLSCKDWREMGFPKFCDIPPEGKVAGFVNDAAVGSYGGIAFTKVFQVLGPYEMILSNVGWSNQYTVRVKGFSTEGLVDGQQWNGVMERHEIPNEVGKYRYSTNVDAEIAIIGTWTYGTAIGSQKTIFTAVPLDFIRRGLTRSQFQQLLE